MRKFNKYSIIIAFVLFFVLGFTGPITTFAVTAVAPSLGTASTFSALGVTLTADGSGATISGDLGATTKTGIWTHAGGSDYLGAAAAGAISDATNAWNTMGSTGGTAWDPAADFSPAPGLYTRSGDATFSGTLTLNGSATDVWIFQINSSLTFTGTVNFTGGAQPCHVFWRIASDATINSGGVDTKFAGTLIANGNVSLVGGPTVDGRIMALTGTLSTAGITNITVPTCASAPTPTCTLSASPTTVVSGNSSTLTWATANAATLNINNGIGSVALSGTRSVSPTTTTTYTGTVDGGAVCTATVTVTTPVVLPILTLAKKILNGGPLSFADFPLTATDTTNPLNFITGINEAGAVTNATVTAGSYSLAEPARSNYTAGLWICTNGGVVVASDPLILVDGSNTTCTVINTYYVAPVSHGGGGHTQPVPPLIDLVKVPSPLALPAGPGPVTYTYTLRNTGKVPVTNVTLVDDTCSPMIFVSGDTNADKKLDVNETWTYDCFKTLSATHTNIATATGWADGISATDIATATVVVGAPVVPPLIHVTKIPNPLVLLAGAGTVTYTEKITNPGTVALSNVHLTDDKCSPMNYISGDTNNNSKLDIAETWTYTCQTKLLATTTNTATASGDANGLTAKDFAIATVVVSSPGLPKTGFPPKEENTSWNIVLLSGFLVLSSISISIFLKKRAA